MTEFTYSVALPLTFEVSPRISKINSMVLVSARAVEKLMVCACAVAAHAATASNAALNLKFLFRIVAP